MNYSNFFSRTILPRPTPAPLEKPASRPPTRKPRKAIRPRKAAVALAAGFALLAFGPAAEVIAQEAPRIVPAPGTVVFAEGPDRPPFVTAAPESETVLFDHPVFEPIQSAMAPVPAPHASALTLILVGGGLLVALVRAGLLLRRDPCC